MGGLVQQSTVTGAWGAARIIETAEAEARYYAALEVPATAA